ncbi:MAG TPA: hypothetical protein VLJ76_02005 [Gaiellaceae bacterium]|nr:hypothetical protein [Gaiellaceae bacterium]
MRLALALALAVAAIAGFAAAPAGATNECRGLQVCVPVAGPWVVVPPSSAVPRVPVRWVLTCPKGYVVGGLDAELTGPAIDVTFDALIGAPVNPGISTSRMAVFVATMARTPAQPESFRPHIGCMPASGGGRAIPTAVRIVPPGHPTVRHVWTFKVDPGSRRVTRTCSAGESLVSASSAVGFFMTKPPATPLMASVHAAETIRAGKIALSIRAGAAVTGRRGVVQLTAVCAGGA